MRMKNEDYHIKSEKSFIIYCELLREDLSKEILTRGFSSVLSIICSLDMGLPLSFV